MSQTFQEDDYFKIDPECLLIGDMGPVNYFPGVRMWRKAIESIGRPLVTGCPTRMLTKIIETLGLEQHMKALQERIPELPDGSPMALEEG